MRGSEYAELRAFVTVVVHGNFARAAADLGISASTLSQTIRELETRLGARLLNRTTRSLSMTDAGERLYARFKPAMIEMEAAVQHVVRFERQRRHATLVAITLDFAASLTDQAIDLFDRLIGGIFRKAEGRHARAFQADGAEKRLSNRTKKLEKDRRLG